MSETNYSNSAQLLERSKKLIAGGGTISVQVLNKVANVARRKMAMTWAETRAFLSSFRGLLSVQPLGIEQHETGPELAEHHGFSIYDAMIVALALHADCDTLWSQDMQHGMVIEKRLRIVDPFRASSTRY